MMALVTGLIIGFLMCIPVGPINVCVVNTQIKVNQKLALAIALGGSIMDLIYFYIILSGLSLLHFSEQQVFYIKLLGTLLIFALGIKDLLEKPQVEKKEEKERTPQEMIAAFLLGIFIYTSNPTLLVTMSALGTFVKSLNLFELNQMNVILCASSLGLGSFLWFLFLVKIINRYKETIREKYLNVFMKTSGGFMVLFSFYMGYKLTN